MDYSRIAVSDDKGLVTITLNLPDRQNAISVKMVEELTRALIWLEDESDAKTVLIKGSGEVFSTGIDFADFPSDGKADIYGFGKWEKVCRMIERLPFPTISAIDGAAKGGGAQLALACDARVATSRSFLQFHEVNMGFLPGMATFRLAKFIGLGRARRIALTGRKVLANEALEIGLIDFLCAPEELETTISTAIAEFANADKTAVELCKRLLDEAFEMPYEEYIGGFLAAQHRATRSERFIQQVKKAHETKTPQGEDSDS